MQTHICLYSDGIMSDVADCVDVISSVLYLARIDSKSDAVLLRYLVHAETSLIVLKQRVHSHQMSPVGSAISKVG